MKLFEMFFYSELISNDYTNDSPNGGACNIQGGTIKMSP